MKIYEKENFEVDSEVLSGKLLFNFIMKESNGIIEMQYIKTLTAPEVVQLIAKLEGRL